MALIVETGSGSATAESYCSVADATLYHTKRGNADAWDAIEDKEAALRKATDYMQQTYKLLWAGTKTSIVQALDWPRANVEIVDSPGYGGWSNFYADNVIPADVKNACAALALKTATTPDLLVDAGRLTQSESVGSIAVTYFEGGSQQVKYEAIDSMLRHLMGAQAGPGLIGVTRA